MVKGKAKAKHGKVYSHVGHKCSTSGKTLNKNVKASARAKSTSARTLAGPCKTAKKGG